MSEAKVVLPAFSTSETVLLWLVLGSALLALAYGWMLRRRVLRRDPGPEAMVAVARAIQEGAHAYLSRHLAAFDVVRSDVGNHLSAFSCTVNCNHWDVCFIRCFHSCGYSCTVCWVNQDNAYFFLNEIFNAADLFCCVILSVYDD